MVAITVLVTTTYGRIIISGDPKQLGPLINSSISKEHGLDISLIERLMNNKVYQYVNSYNNFSELTQDTPQKIALLFVGIITPCNAQVTMIKKAHK